MGLLRNFTGPMRERIKGIAKAKKFPAAIAEMKKLLVAKGAPAKASARKQVPAAKPAPAKKTASKVSAAKIAERKKLTISPKRAAQLKVQGMYIGLMRSLPDAEKAKIKAISKDNGMKAAIEAMKKAGRSTPRQVAK